MTIEGWYMELIPQLKIGWLNGWIAFGLIALTEGICFVVFPKHVVKRLFDRSGWGKTQLLFTVMGKVFSLACLILLVLTPLKVGSSVFIIGTLLFASGLASLIAALLSFKSTPPDQPVTTGLYRISRHPQLFTVFVALLGACIAIGSWAALLMLISSKALQHFGILAEEDVCLRQYGDSYRAYMERVPRYFIFF